MDRANSMGKQILPPFFNISHIVFSTNINAWLQEGCEIEEKKENQVIFSLPIKLFPKSKGFVGTCAMYGGNVSKLMVWELICTYILKFSLEIYMVYINEQREYLAVCCLHSKGTSV